MITRRKALSIFSDVTMFKKVSEKILYRNKKVYVFKMIPFKEKGFNYNFRVKETEYGDYATVDFGRWTPFSSQMCCSDICEDHLLEMIISLCKRGML